MPSAAPALFTPLQVGDMTLQQRIVLAPLTRMRADAKHTHHEHAVTYYGQRASAPGTLLISEATFISPQAGGYTHAPGVYTDAQIAAWKKIVDEVHAKGSYIYLQLWAHGRAAEPDQLKKDGDFDVVSASDVAFEGGATPRPLTEPELAQYVKDYAQAAKNFVEKAGGDGVEIHSANGYLIQQFLDLNSNKRTDRYGGSAENRARFGLEVVDAVVAAVGAKKTGIRMTPFTTFQGMKMKKHEDTIETYTYYVKSIKEAHPELAYLHLVEGRVAGIADVEEKEDEKLDFLLDIWAPKPVILAGGYNAEDAFRLTAQHPNVAIAFGRYFISNPDLVERIRKGIAWTPYKRELFYVPGENNTEGYIDYPFAEESSEAEVQP